MIVIVHGMKDPLINYEHAKKYAILMQNSKKLYLKGVGTLPTKKIFEINN